jgi:hypothetical protein
MNRIALCGSTKFKEAFLDINKKLSLQGNIVYSVAFFGHADNEPLSVDQKNLLDQVHIGKIDNSDEIFVIDLNGYIGESTQKEIIHAKTNGKKRPLFNRRIPKLLNGTNRNNFSSWLWKTNWLILPERINYRWQRNTD